ncbi:hypothetical protein AtNW77_Chr5g0097041 [Arabidopsis thaliana]|uniref:Uncharacterized protein n=3 Tax=Arabidopsis TaxID=3701 RepID=A0A178U8Z7_ARATH|nr:hypothetical protein ISN45_At05g012320 [Arabidopsis thaliana x Arabidopsis arenosa]KAG7609080.1 hypothetical protein ISN44_As05g012280 [Arabidopsis suecica]OAO90323.1 hypothetical protein AXX17_AT5G12980 [Arabidopsis thaliana]CAA0402376.1 unnamed protein product [Arabidopsis thaliana]
MSWLRTAVNKAVEVGNRKNITRTVKNYADSVVQHAGQAVAEGAKLFQDRIGVGAYKSVHQTIQRLEEAAVSYRGQERALLITRWLSVLKEIDRATDSSLKDKQLSSEEQLASDEAKKREWVLYYDPDIGGEPLNFRDVFLQSQALEGIVLSMIIEPPHDEEITLLLEMFGLCLNGGKEVHDAIVSSMQDLATVFSSYKDEVLVKQDELLQFAQNAITGLKINAEMLRIDAEASDLRKKLEKMNASQIPQESEDKEHKETPLTIEAFKETLAKIRLCSRLEGLLIRKRQLSNGDSPDIHAQKVDKLRVLLESLANSTSKAEKRISENRLQKEEALKARVVKANETGEKEKELGAEIAQLEKQRDELEAELKRVNLSLAAAQARFRNATEERDQFGEANNQIIAHLKTKDDDLSKSVVACKKEAEVIKTWINFLEDTWLLQCSHIETKDKQTLDELEKHEDYFSDVALNILSVYKKEVAPLISRIENYVENLKNLGPGSEKPPNADQGDNQVSNPRKILEEEYIDYETKIITTFSIVDNVKEQFQVLQSKLDKKDDRRVKELFDDMEKMRQQFESIARPTLEIEIPSPRSSVTSPKSSATSPKSPKPSSSSMNASTESTQTQKPELSNSPQAPNPAAGSSQEFNPEAELAELESEFGKVARDYSADEVDGWEFDELEKELQ